jgi:tRNA nucleotidyltransferase (CCA-adding enzyme)
MPELEVPSRVSEIINVLNAHGYKAHIVGRCVRELILGREPSDYDVITNAERGRVCDIFAKYTLKLDNYVKGEIIVQVPGMAVLVAQYRAGFTEDGEAIFTEDIEEDLAHRAFSFNAIAYHPLSGMVDPFGGMDALRRETCTVSAVNIPKGRLYVSPFEAEPVTILQALGYYSSGEYAIAPLTRTAILEHIPFVKKIEPADLRTELSWVIRGRRAGVVMDEYFDVFAELIPELTALQGFDQCLPEHSFDLLTHTLKCVNYASPIIAVRYAALFHELGKPDCFSLDSSGRGHYYGHCERSRILARRIMKRLGFTEDDIDVICFIIAHHDDEIGPDRRSLKRIMRDIPPQRLKLILMFKYANMKAMSPEFDGAATNFKRQIDIVNEITAMKECYAYSQMAVTRYDLIQHGLCESEKQADFILSQLLDICMENSAANNKSRLLDLAKRIQS